MDFSSFGNRLLSLLPNLTGTYSFGYTGQPTGSPTPSPTPPSQPQMQAQTAPIASPTPSPQPMPSAFPNEARLRQNISNTWGSDSPILQNLPLFEKAGQQLSPKENPLLPIVLALRETQGGKDNLKPNAITGNNNYFNIRGVQGNQTRFINYPDLQTALFGGQNGPDQSQGLVGLLNGPVYQDYQNSGNIRDLFNHWSPPSDGNGQLPEQEQNFRWILNQLVKWTQMIF